jgi:hypothetical protein
MNHEQEKQNTYNVKFWRVRFISSATRTQQCVPDLHLAVNNTKLLVFSTDMKQWGPLELFSSYKIFHTTVKNISVLWPRTIFTKFGVSLQIFVKIPSIRFHDNEPSRSLAVTFGYTDVHGKANSHFSRPTPRRLN